MTEWSLEDLIRSAASTQAHITELTGRLDNLKAMIRQQLPIGESHTSRGGLTVRVVSNRRFDPATATAYLSEEWLTKISALRPDAKLARDLLDPDDFAGCQKESTPRVIFE